MYVKGKNGPVWFVVRILWILFFILFPCHLGDRHQWVSSWGSDRCCIVWTLWVFSQWASGCKWKIINIWYKGLTVFFLRETIWIIIIILWRVFSMNISFKTSFNYHTVNLCGKSRRGFVCLISIPFAQTKVLDESRASVRQFH